MLRLTVVMMWAVLCGGAAAEEPADLIFVNGIVWSPSQPSDAVEPSPPPTAVAIRGERIAGIGGDQQIAALRGPATEVIDLEGRFLMPGFIESHGHFLKLGRLRMDVDLMHAQTWEEVVELMAARAARTPPGEWVVGRGWHQEKWTRPAQPNGDRYPHHAALSAAIPDHPVLLLHGTGHAAIGNARAMQLAGVDRNTPDPAGGEVLHDAAGEPTGVFRENAEGLLLRPFQKWRSQRTDEQLQQEELLAFELATEECLRKGVTSFQDAGVSFADVEFFQQLGREGKLKLRHWLMISASPRQLAEGLAGARCINAANGHLTVRAIKCMADGAIGAHGALLLAAYDDLPTSTGLRVASLAELRETALLALQHDYQYCTHAIGDRANREVLDLYDEMLRSDSGVKECRWRIEHAQHIHPDDFPRFGDLGVIASMQANHATSDGPFVVTRLGEQRSRHGAYAWRNVLDAGGRIANGTDVPVEDVDPLLCLRAAITRRMANGEQFFPEQCMTPEEALRSYTLDAAYAAFEDHEKGVLTPGALADVVVLSGDPRTTDEAQLAQLKVWKTVVGGTIVFAGEAAQR